MEAQQFLAEFGHIANAPSGIDRLRDMVLDLAVQGRLALSSESKESTLGLLDEIGRWRASQTQSKKGRRAKFEVPISDLDKPFSIPEHWVWVRNSDIFSLTKGKNPKDLGPEGKYPYLDIEALDRGNIQRYTNDEQAPRSSKADILVVCDGSRSGLVLDGNDGVIGSTLARVDTLPTIQHFVKLLFLHGYRRFNAEKKGAAIPHLDTARLLARPCGLPPISDQESIVAKVDELMALCDKLESQQQARRKLQNALRKSTLQAVASSQRPHELQTTWARLADNFGQLFHAPEDVVAFKGLILDLAVSGELLNTEHRHTASGADLLRAIAKKRIEWSIESEGQEQKEALAMLKKLRSQQMTIPDAVLPEHWAWASLLQVSQAVVDCHNKTAPYVSEGIHLIRTTDIRNGRMDLSRTRKISEETYAYWARRMPPKSGDIFFTREAPMGEAAIVPDGEKVCLGQRSMLIRLFPDLFSNRFLLYVIQSRSFQTRMIEAAIGMTVKHLRVGGVEDLVVPVPPMAEQDQIVAIVDALFRMCEHYEDQLSRKRRIATNFAASAVSSLTGIAIEEEEEPMKAPQTQLIAPLSLGTAPDIKAQAPLATILARHNGEMDAKDLWQRFGGEIDTFYAQLKTEVARGWILEPTPAEMREKPADTVNV
ncbi:restriction endonuclease subunit S [Halopseudomonas salegens]|uniref:Type I restriction enzyme, S subunit n=1 Tax=Halopseudomonas salegens TaxID=1434072 RepID=A0A1H2E1Y2_9GAMM|nr:restriction endonuclease subunit S [Halopseudomonas salegens]SDT89034.1 type I restriction enzyme, S subunit [Halopseudomonas salegens]